MGSNRQRPLRLMYRHRQPMFSDLLQVSGVEPSWTTKVGEKRPCCPWSAKINTNGIRSICSGNVPTMPTNVFPMPQTQAKPESMKVHVDRILSARTAKSIATERKSLIEYPQPNYGKRNDLQFPPANDEVTATQKLRTAQLGELAAIMANMDTPKIFVCYTIRLPKLSATRPSTIAPTRSPEYCAAGRNVACFGPKSKDADGVTMRMATSNDYKELSVGHIQGKDAGI